MTLSKDEENFINYYKTLIVRGGVGETLQTTISLVLDYMGKWLNGLQTKRKKTEKKSHEMSTL